MMVMPRKIELKRTVIAPSFENLGQGHAIAVFTVRHRRVMPKNHPPARTITKRRLELRLLRSKSGGGVLFDHRGCINSINRKPWGQIRESKMSVKHPPAITKICIPDSCKNRLAALDIWPFRTMFPVLFSVCLR